MLKGKSAIDTAMIRELAQVLADTDLTEIEVEDGDRKIRVSRNGGAAVQMAAAPAPAAAYVPMAQDPAQPAPVNAPAPAAPPPGHGNPSPNIRRVMDRKDFRQMSLPLIHEEE